jgi:hypothetical protein
MPLRDGAASVAPPRRFGHDQAAMTHRDRPLLFALAGLMLAGSSARRVAPARPRCRRARRTHTSRCSPRRHRPAATRASTSAFPTRRTRRERRRSSCRCRRACRAVLRAHVRLARSGGDAHARRARQPTTTCSPRRSGASRSPRPAGTSRRGSSRLRPVVAPARQAGRHEARVHGAVDLQRGRGRALDRVRPTATGRRRRVTLVAAAEADPGPAATAASATAAAEEEDDEEGAGNGPAIAR